MENKAALPYLFGDGSGMVSRVLIGGAPTLNPYNSMHQVLGNLGILSQAKTNHNTHFHIDLRAPAIKPLDPPQNLLAGNYASEQALSVEDATLLASAQALVDDAAMELNINQGELTMFIMDVPPDVPTMYAPMVIAQAAQTKDSTRIDRTIGICHLIENDPDSRLSAVNSQSPVIAVWAYFKNLEKTTIDEAAYKAAKITLLQSPQHGELMLFDETQSGRYLSSNPDYFGTDRATLLVEIGGYKVKVEYFFKLLPHVGAGAQGSSYDKKENCPKGRVWKISLDAKGNQVLTLIDSNALQTDLLASSLLNSQVGANSGVTLNIADLSGAAVGQTTGSNITLDTNAANHNWFIDTTPGSNEEFLPTSNPYEWVAKEGTAAYGKMDMLSVLLHEYGHALGIDHSADGHDYMATTLTAGVRRLPSAEELALMQQLVGEVKVEMASVSTQGSGNTPSQLPLLPLGGFGLAFLGRLRGTRYGSLNVEADLSTLVTQYAVTANAKLTNGNFSVASGMPVDNG